MDPITGGDGRHAIPVGAKETVIIRRGASARRRVPKSGERKG